MAQYVVLSSDPAMTEGTEQEDEGMGTASEVVGPALKAAMGSQEHLESSQAAMEPGMQVLEVALVTPAERDELMRNLTELQQLDASGAIDGFVGQWPGSRRTQEQQTKKKKKKTHSPRRTRVMGPPHCGRWCSPRRG